MSFAWCHKFYRPWSCATAPYYPRIINIQHRAEESPGKNFIQINVTKTVFFSAIVMCYYLIWCAKPGIFMKKFMANIGNSGNIGFEPELSLAPGLLLRWR